MRTFVIDKLDIYNNLARRPNRCKYRIHPPQKFAICFV